MCYYCESLRDRISDCWDECNWDKLLLSCQMRVITIRALGVSFKIICGLSAEFRFVWLSYVSYSILFHEKHAFVMNLSVLKKPLIFNI